MYSIAFKRKQKLKKTGSSISTIQPNKLQIKKAKEKYVKLWAKYRTNIRDIKIGQVKEAKKLFKKLQLEQLVTPYNESNRVTKGVVYVRYASDWVLILTCLKEEAIEIEQKLARFLGLHLKMQPDKDKTIITPTSK